MSSGTVAYGLIHNPANSPIHSNVPNLHWECDYLNIYLFRNSTTSGGAFTIIPNSARNCSEEGILAIADIFQINPTADDLTHETGHYLGLLHPWGDNTAPNCNPGDHVDDTDPINILNTKCTDLNCNGVVTNTSNNIMSYAKLSCTADKFTPKQITRMCTALKYFCRLRKLWSDENLVKTGLLTSLPTLAQAMPNPTITQNTNWVANVNINSVLTIDGTLTIESGATLNIEGATVKFCNQCGSTTNRGKIIIKRGGTSILTIQRLQMAVILLGKVLK